MRTENPNGWPERTRLRRALLRWFDANRRDLPWRRTRDPYAIWVSEVMLQQTQVATVIPYWGRFLARFPTAAALAAAPAGDVLAAWRGLGYYSRARNLKAAAQQLVAAHSGRLPRSIEALRALPGFGRYTAGAVASIAFGAETAVVDGNVARVLSRLAEVEGVPGERAREERLWALAGELVRGERPGDLNQALMELGALVCRFETPACRSCPVRSGCRALGAGRVSELPPKRVRPERKRLAFAVAVWRRRGALLLGRREAAGLFGGLWELPCAAIATEAGAEKALSKALGGAKIGPRVATVRRTLTHRKLELQLFEVQAGTSPPRAVPGYLELRWASARQSNALGMSTAMQRALEAAVAAAAASPTRRGHRGCVG